MSSSPLPSPNLPVATSSTAAVAVTAVAPPSTTSTTGSSSSSIGKGPSVISTIIFDVDDTLYDVNTGFTAHRNGRIVQEYMVQHLKFPSLEAARVLRDEYFAKYHSTAKALTVAQEEGKFPDPTAPTFDTGHLAEYWATHCDYSLLGPPKHELYQSLLELSQNVNLVAFSNGPRIYVKRVLKELGLLDLFEKESSSSSSSSASKTSLPLTEANNHKNDGKRLFAVDDVLPYCKPEPEAFDKIFQHIGVPDPASCIMVEDSMKNLRQAKALGMKTILITGTSETGRILPEDRPEIHDPAVDGWMERIEDLPKVLPGLWKNPPMLDPPNATSSTHQVLSTSLNGDDETISKMESAGTA